MECNVYRYNINTKKIEPMNIFRHSRFEDDVIKAMRTCKTKEAIAERREMIIFESIKSVMKAELFGTPNVVSAETSTLNMFQIKLALSMHCDVVIAFDNDVSRAESAKFLSTLRKYTNVYWIDDKERLLGTYKDKMSPVDKGKEIWDYLYKRKVRI